MLHLVSPKPSAGQGIDPPKRRKGAYPASLFYTADEARNVRNAIRGAARTFGGLAALARAIGVTPRTLHGKLTPGPAVALAVARVVGLSLDAMLSGKLSDADKCPTCGAAKERAS